MVVTLSNQPLPPESFEAMEPPEHRERRARVLTVREKFLRELRDGLVNSGRTLIMAGVLTTLIVAAFLTLDIPVRVFDGVFSLILSTQPSVWLTWGHMFIALALAVTILFTRRHSGDMVSRAVMVAWIFVAIAIVFELSVLAPVIERGDFPSARFAGAFVASAMLGQLFAVAFYDVARGGGAWWRAPFYSALMGFAVTAAIYFPTAYWQTGLPWAAWLVGDLMVKTLIALTFLPVYGLLRRRFKPRGGYGGL